MPMVSSKLYRNVDITKMNFMQVASTIKSYEDDGWKLETPATPKGSKCITFSIEHNSDGEVVCKKSI